MVRGHLRWLCPWLEVTWGGYVPGWGSLRGLCPWLEVTWGGCIPRTMAVGPHDHCGESPGHEAVGPQGCGAVGPQAVCPWVLG